MEKVLDLHCSGELKVPDIFSNEGMDRKGAQSLMVQFD
jgi:hypothetical protein